MTDKRTTLVWCDLESTGLDPDGGRILEYAMVFTDLELNEITSFEGVIPQYQSEILPLMNDYVVNMHTKSGLLEAIRREQAGNQRTIDTISYGGEISCAEERILNTMDAIRDNNTIFVIAGSNILFDVKWLMVHMPKIIDQIDHRGVVDGPESYRCLDVSSYRTGFPDIFTSPTDASHRAMDDIKFSIEMHAKMRAIVENSWKYEQLA